MNTFKQAIQEQTTYTQNGMVARESSANACVNFFYKAGSSRNKDIFSDFIAAYVENPDIAVRILLWLRDIREGAGERDTFRNILRDFSKLHPEIVELIIPVIPELGRWDDLLIFDDKSECQNKAFELIASELRNKNGLVAKWMPREKSAKRDIANKLRNFLNMDSASYRKMLSSLSSTVEDKMCAKKWSDIDYSHVPSVAASRYSSAFYLNDTARYSEYVKSLSNSNANTKVNAGAIFPHDVISKMISGWYSMESLSDTEIGLMREQWRSLPNYMGNSRIMPMIDVSGSMYVPISGNGGTLAIHVAIALGLYIADKNTGSFSDTYLTFSQNPQLRIAQGEIDEKISQLVNDEWGMNTNLERAFEKILDVAKTNQVSPNEMPEYLVILSDMEFDVAVKTDQTAFEMVKYHYQQSGYQMPKIVFWNLNSASHVPVRYDENGTAMVSGFNTSIMKSLLSDADLSDFSPENVMLDTVMKDRYSIF